MDEHLAHFLLIHRGRDLHLLIRELSLREKDIRDRVHEEVGHAVEITMPRLLCTSMACSTSTKHVFHGEVGTRECWHCFCSSRVHCGVTLAGRVCHVHLPHVIQVRGS